MLDLREEAIVATHKKLAIVTGTSSGIGSGLAAALIERNWDVVGLSRRDASINSPRYEHVLVDLAHTTGLEGHILSTLKHKLTALSWERVALVNNAAAIGSLKGLEDISEPELSKVYAVNVIAPALLMGFVIREVPESSWLRIINVSSGAAHKGLPGISDYSGSKAALRLTGMTLAAEIEQSNRSRTAILSYEPGVVDTEMQVKARTPAAGFPSQAVFQGFHSQGILQPVGIVIDAMLDFVEDTQSPVFTEKRFTPS